MARILVSGLINLETTLRVERFPIAYQPVRYPFGGVESTVSGVGFNVAKALGGLGDRVTFLSLIGRDPVADLVTRALAEAGISGEYVRPALPDTPQSVILYDGSGRRQINVDLKDIQERRYPEYVFNRALARCELAVLCNVNFSRPFLEEARAAGKAIATDVHAISDLEDDYNRAFMAAADILFMSDERLPCQPEVWAREVAARYGPQVLVIGLGAAGALLAVPADGFMERLPAVNIRSVVNTVGAGDALFSAFVHFFHKHRDPYRALRQATIFAAFKIGERGAADGFLDEANVAAWMERVYPTH